MKILRRLYIILLYALKLKGNNMFYDEDDEALTPQLSERERRISQANRRVENYSTVEIVAVPPDFDIHQYLTMRESAGIFKHKSVDLKNLSIISDSVKCSSIFCIQNNIRINPVTCMFYLKILDELNLIVRSVYNPIREDIERYMRMIDEEDGEYLSIKDQVTKTINFTIINVYQMMEDDTMNEVMEIARRLQDSQKMFEESLNKIAM